MKKLLETAVRNGTGNTARLPGVTAYGKTGTTQNFRDALFVGFAGDLIVGVWFGNDDNSPMNGVTGRGLPAETWKKFMMEALPQLRRSATASSESDDDGDEIEGIDDAGAAAAAIEAMIAEANAAGLTPEQAAEAVDRAVEAGEAIRDQIEAAAEEAADPPQP